VNSATPDFTTYNPTTFETTGGSSSVYKTIADLNAKSFSAGDNIYFRKGQTWNEQLTISQSGSSGNQITFGAFGSGNKPIIDGQNTRNYAITTNAFNYVTLQDIQIQNAAWANFWSDVVSTGAVLTNIDSVGGVRGIWFRKPSNSTFTNITAINSSTMCFQLGQLGTNVTINGITASGCSGYPGIYLNQLTDVTASNLTAIDNLITGIMFQDITGTWNISDVVSGGLNNGNTGAGIHILGAVAGNNANFNLDNVTSSYNTVEGFFLQNVRDGTVTGVINNSLSEHNGDNGFEFDTTKNITIQNTISRYNGLNGIGSWYNTNDNITIKDCTINNNLFDGISFHGVSSGILIERCTSSNNGTIGSNNSGDGFTAHETVSNFRVYNSIAYGNLNSGAAMINSASGEIINNTFYNNGSSGFNRAAFWSQVSGGAGWIVKNNIFSENYPREIFTDASGLSYATLDNNLFYHPSDAKLASLDNGTTEQSWATYHTTNGYEPNSIYSDPLFFNKISSDFHLTRLSSAIDGGLDYSSTFTSDFSSTVRPQGSDFDLGAYEYKPLTVTINQAGGQADPTDGSIINFTVIFSESVSDFATGDVTLSGTAGATTATVTGSGTTYNVAVTGMTDSGTVIASIDVDKAIGATSNTNNASASTDNSVTYDISDPVISVVASTATSTGATITWTTDEDSSSKVDYGLTDSYGSTTIESDTSPRVSSHTVELTGLTACTTYHYSVRSTDALGNEGVSTDNTFITTGCSSSSSSSSSSNSSSSSSSTPSCDKTAPSSAPLLWGATTKGANSILLQFGSVSGSVDNYALEFGTEPGKYLWGATAIGNESSREYLVKSLSANTTYYFRIRAGNGCATGDWSKEISAKTWGNVSTNDLVFTSSELTPVKEDQKVTNSCQTYTVKSGDNLWFIASSLLGDGNQYKKIIEQNKDSYSSLQSSNSLKVGWELKINCGATNKQNEEDTTQDSESSDGYKVKVKVVDTDKNPVEGAKVTIHSKVQEATTDKDGVAQFTGVEAGDHKVLIAYKNFEGEQSVNLSGDVKEFSLNVTVQEKPFSLSLLAWGIIGILVLIITILIVVLVKRKK